MRTLLHIDSSPLGEASVSRHLSNEFVRSWKTANPEGQVIHRDLAATELPVISAEWIVAAYTPAASRTDSQKQLLTKSDALIAELRAADEYVFGVPMHNFSVPSALKLWIDLIARAGETFAYSDAGPVGLLTDKKATFVVTAGGSYAGNSPMASWNYVDPYLRTVFGFLGVTDATFVDAGGAAALMSGKVDRPEFLKPHVESVRALFQTA
jgi:FMN-dependent NADH-azoreductase